MTPKRLRKKISVLGERFVTKHGENYTVIDYNHCTDVTIQYDDGATAKTYASNLRKGNPDNPNRITTCGVGYTGQGSYLLGENGKKTASYVKWQGMLNRVYGIRRKSNICYNDCTVNSIWYNYQNFAEWYAAREDKLKDYKGEICLDKDILKIGCKEYSPTNCSLVPSEINIACKLVTKFYFDSRRGLFNIKLTRVNDTVKNQSTHIGRASTIEECLRIYSAHKDKYIGTLAATYKKVLDKNTYDALCNFNTTKRFEINRKEINEI